MVDAILTFRERIVNTQDLGQQGQLIRTVPGSDVSVRNCRFGMVKTVNLKFR